MATTNYFIIKCRQCGAEIPVEADIKEVASYDRGLGNENIYQQNINKACPECDNKIEVLLTVSEFPMGVFNLIDKDEDGADIIKTPDYYYDYGY